MGRRLVPDSAHAAWPSWLFEDVLSERALDVAQNWVRAGLLDNGEAEALALAQEQGSEGFVTDDAAAREMAVALGFEVSGSLGVILRAAARGAVSPIEAFDALERLQNRSTLWLSAKVRDEARIALERIVETRGSQPQ